MLRQSETIYRITTTKIFFSGAAKRIWNASSPRGTFKEGGIREKTAGGNYAERRISSTTN